MPRKSNTTNKTYAELSLELDETIAKLQDSDVAVDDVVHYYEQAMRLIRQLEKHLDQAENRVRVIGVKFKDV